jgi:hypothetical protein
MNNTKTLAIVAVLTAATLVVGTLAATIAIQSAFAGGKKDKEDKYVMKGGDKQEKFMKMKGKDKEDTTYNKRLLHNEMIIIKHEMMEMMMAAAVMGMVTQ